MRTSLDDSPRGAGPPASPRPGRLLQGFRADRLSVISRVYQRSIGKGSFGANPVPPTLQGVWYGLAPRPWILRDSGRGHQAPGYFLLVSYNRRDLRARPRGER